MSLDVPSLKWLLSLLNGGLHSMMKAVFSSFFLLLLAIPTFAEDLPKYEGVYLETTGGFVELRPLTSHYYKYKPVFYGVEDLIEACFGMDCIPHSLYRMYSALDLQDAPSVDAASIMGIATNGTGITVKGVSQVVSLDQFFGSNLYDIRLFLTASRSLNSEEPGNRSFIPFGPDIMDVLVDSDWGLFDDAVRKRNLDIFNAKYEIPNGFFTYPTINHFARNILSSQKNGYPVETQVCPNQCGVFLYVIITGDKVYPFFTKLSRTSFDAKYISGD